jgi:hypothetical protein
MISTLGKKVGNGSQWCKEQADDVYFLMLHSLPALGDMEMLGEMVRRVLPPLPTIVLSPYTPLFPHLSSRQLVIKPVLVCTVAFQSKGV